MPRLPRWLGCLALAWALSPAVALADPLRASSIVWIATPGAEDCGTTEQLVHAVEERVQKRAFVATEQANASIQARAEHQSGPPHWHAVLEVRNLGGNTIGRREFDSSAPSCRELRDSVALAVALMIDPDAVLHGLGMKPTPGPPVPPPARSETPEPVAPPPQARQSTIRRPASWRATPAASLSLGVGFLPSPSPGAIAEVALHPPEFWSIDLLGGLWGSESALATAGASATFSLAAAGVSLCPQSVAPGQLGVELCSGVLFGAVRSAGRGFSVSASDAGALVNLLESGALRAPIAAGLALQLRVDIGLSLYHDRFVYFDPQGAHKVFEPSVLSGSVAAGFAVDLP